MAVSRKSILAIVGSLAVLAALSLAACGSPDDPGVDAAAARAAEAATLPGLEVCSLLTEDEAAEFLGVPVTYVDPFKIRTFRACEWSNDEGSLSEIVQVGIFDFAVDSDLFREAASAAGATTVEQFPGVGDEAYWTGQHELYVRSGDRMFSVIPAIAGDRDQAAEIARLIIPRLN